MVWKEQMKQRCLEMWCSSVCRFAADADVEVDSHGSSSNASHTNHVLAASNVWASVLGWLSFREAVQVAAALSPRFRTSALAWFRRTRCLDLSPGLAAGLIETDAGLESLLAAFPNLIRLDLRNIHFPIDNAISKSSQLLANLEVVDLRSAASLSGSTIQALASGCSSLRSIKFAFAYDRGLQDVSAIAALSRCISRTLSEVTIEDFSSCLATLRDEGGVESAGNAALIGLLQRQGSNLKLLSLPCWPLTEALVTEVASCCPGLQHLNIEDPSKLCEHPVGVTPHCLASLAGGCPSLRALSLCQAWLAISPPALSALAGGCPHLEELDLSGRWDEFGSPMRCVDDDAMTAALSRGLQKLTKLNLSLTATSDATLSALGANCPALKCLDLSACTGDFDGHAGGYGVGDRNFEFAAGRYTDEGVAALVRGCRILECLDLHRCCQLTDRALVAIAENCEELRFLDISGADRIPTEDRSYMPRTGAASERPMLFTETAVQTLAAGCPKLSYLCVAFCPGIPGDALSGDSSRRRYGNMVVDHRAGQMTESKRMSEASISPWFKIQCFA
eukprot:NODE_1841_length_2359_cov_21.197133.p1 GENE.NODE_1841_length_2359_cov_21.197133~~NODE_1841_length_2359_cov_21.197133.p1  ORF type:complete len:563 (-),score=14.07 NODE_1841_length_2359_cov_21.197133:362-2050(-)